MKRVLKILAVLIVALPLGFAGYVWYQLQPKQLDLPLKEPLVSIASDDGQNLLDSAEHVVDFGPLSAVYAAQELRSYCGVASGAMVLQALGRETDQGDFFTEGTRDVRSRFDVSLGGMSLVDLGGLLEAHGLQVQTLHGDQLTLEEFRGLVIRNLSTAGDYLIVNYQRATLGQGRVGHISPIGAYNAAADTVLILDTASYKYPSTWAPLPLVYEAMQPHDSTTERPRGLVEVSL